MNAKWFGDSFDIVKKFFLRHLREDGYVVYVDPMFTGRWQGLERRFYQFLGAEHVKMVTCPGSRLIQ